MHLWFFCLFFACGYRVFPVMCWKTGFFFEAGRFSYHEVTDLQTVQESDFFRNDLCARAQDHKEKHLGCCLHFGSPNRLPFLISLLPLLLEFMAMKWMLQFPSNLIWVQPEMGEKARPAFHLIWSKSTEVLKKSQYVSNELRGKRLCFSPGDGSTRKKGFKKK